MGVSEAGQDRATRAYELMERAGEFLRAGHRHKAAWLLGEAKLLAPDKG